MNFKETKDEEDEKFDDDSTLLVCLNDALVTFLSFPSFSFLRFSVFFRSETGHSSTPESVFSLDNKNFHLIDFTLLLSFSIFCL